MKVVVVFLQNGKDKFAYFPTITANLNGDKTAYSRKGLYKGCSSEYAKESKDWKSYGKLKKELESIGYDLLVMDKNYLEYQNKYLR